MCFQRPKDSLESVLPTPIRFCITTYPITLHPRLQSYCLAIAGRYFLRSLVNVPAFAKASAGKRPPPLTKAFKSLLNPSSPPSQMTEG